MLSLSVPRPLLVFAVALGQLHRYKLSKQREDLNRAIVYFTGSILLPPLSWLRHGPFFRPFILDALYFLAHALVLRSNVDRQPEDAIDATKYLIHIRNQPQESTNILPHEITGFLLDALVLQVALKAGNMMQNLREIAVLSRELFILPVETCDVDIPFLTHLIFAHVMNLMVRIPPDFPDQILDELIECLRAARKRRPDLLDGRIAFATLLWHRYCKTFTNDDYEEAASVLDGIIMDTSGNIQGESEESVANAQGFAKVIAMKLAMNRWLIYNTPEHLEETIYRSSTWFSSSYKERYPLVGIDPEDTAKLRFEFFGSVEGIEEPSGILQLAPDLSEKNRRIVDEMESLLFRIRNSDDTTKIDEAVEKGRSILPSEHDVVTLAMFATLFYEAFDRTDKIKYLNETINLLRQLIETPLPQVLRSFVFPLLSTCLLARSELLPGYRTQDLDESMELRSQYVSTHASAANLPNRFAVACIWAHCARSHQHSSTSSAYKAALSLVHGTPLFSPTLQLQHATLAMHGDAQTLPLDYASYQLDHHQLEEAIETLERGRALLWSEMRHLRAPIDQLLEAYPNLGRRFSAVNRNLEELITSVPPSHKLGKDDGAADGLRAADPFGRLVIKQRGFVEERAKLISQIQALPGFHSFLAFPSFDTIRSAASSGPVIIINHSRWRSDILIILHNMPPSLISTPDDFYSRTTALKDKLLDSQRKFGVGSTNYEETLATVLCQLYELIGKPVINRLRQLQVPEQSRIWWCPTSVLCRLPLHAMGPIPSVDGEQRYFSDLYICSYTPTLSALIQSCHHSADLRSSDRPPILLIAQPDSLPNVRDEIKVVQSIGTKVTSLISEAATPATVIDGFHHHRFVHFACHGALEAGKPFDAGFELHGDARLTLLDIVRAHLPTAEFAFLAACHTAEVTEGSAIDEGLHLAAAVQYCGFRSVVGTMWAMADTDGRDLAKYFYKALFSGSRGIPYHEGSAKALQSAVKKLRKKRGITLERWVNFVHYGA